MKYSFYKKYRDTCKENGSDVTVDELRYLFYGYIALSKEYNWTPNENGFKSFLDKNYLEFRTNLYKPKEAI
jgi:hypothetical protein